MVYAICSVPVSPVRSEPAHRSEMTSQVLLGEWVTVEEEQKGEWIRIRCGYDGYEGWSQKSQWVLLTELPPGIDQPVYTGDWTDTVLIDQEPAHISMGSPLIGPAQADLQIGTMRLRYMASLPWNAAAAVPTAEAIESRARHFLNTPYLWGGRSVFGIDCSGFAQMVMKFFNIRLLRDAYMQAGQGEGIGFLQEARCGDLAFFDNEEGRIIHVGILLNDHSIIHAAGKVRIDPIDNEGIIHAGTGKRTHHLRVIRRVIV